LLETAGLKEDKMLDFLKRAIWIGAGLAAMTAEKIEETVKEIVNRGHMSEKEGRELIDDLIEKSKKARKDLGERVENTVQETLQRLRIPGRKEVDELKARIEQLEKASQKKE
jgi:polyhydroxyalkanoate synthesis regulator phasin